MCTIEENRQCHRFPNRFKRRQALQAVVTNVPKHNQDDQEEFGLVTADEHGEEGKHTRNDANVPMDINFQLLQNNDNFGIEPDVWPNPQIHISPTDIGLYCPEECEVNSSLASPSAHGQALSTHGSEICSNLGQAGADETGGHESRKQKMRVDKSQQLSSGQSEPVSVKELGPVAEGQASGWPNGDIENDTENRSEDLSMNEIFAEAAPDVPSLLKPSVNHPQALSQFHASAQTNTAGCEANAGSEESTQDVSSSLFENPRCSQTPVPDLVLHPLPMSRLDDDDTGDELQQQERPPPQTSAEESAASAVPDAAVSNERPDAQQSPGFNQQGNSTSLQIADTVRLRPLRIRGTTGRDFLMPRILGACVPDFCTTATVVDLKGGCVDMRCLQDRQRVGRTREIRWVERLHYIDDHQVHEDGSDIEQLRGLFRSRHTEEELGLCQLCSTHRADCVILNCQHCVVCVYCARVLTDCPLCGGEVLRFIRIY